MICKYVLLSVIIKEWIWIAMEIILDPTCPSVRRGFSILDAGCSILDDRCPPPLPQHLAFSRKAGLNGKKAQGQEAGANPTKGGSALGMTRFENKTTAWGLLNSFVMYDHA